MKVKTAGEDRKEARPLRADARRNDKRLLDVAHKLFTEKGPEVPMEEIARRAKVGIGTLYRHFPTRTDLLEAVYLDQMEGLIARSVALRGSLPAGEALFAWLQDEAEHMMANRALKTCLISTSPGRLSRGNWKERLIGAGAALLEAAEKEGAVRAGLDGTNLLNLVHAVTVAAEKAPDPPAQARFLLQVMMDGLRPRAAAGGE
jgi:AcrR family transcriptional regulator